MSEKFKGKAACCIEMLQILSTGRTYKVSELAEMLEVNPRNITEYAKELREVSMGSVGGFYIETVPGRYGGYRLNGNACVPALQLSLEDKNALIDLFNFAMTKKDFINKNGCLKTMGKIFSSLLIDASHSNGIISTNKINSLIDESIIQKNYNAIDKAIKQRRTIKITYRWLKEPTSTILVNPYQLFLYDNEWRFFGWLLDHDNNGDPICYLKLSRVENIELTDGRFKIPKFFKLDDYVKKNVFTQNGEMFKVKLIASGIRAKLLKEKQYGYNQEYVDLPDGSVEITCEMQKNHSTYNTILGFGDLVEVVEPDWLRDKIAELAKNIFDKYKKK